jgi:lysozyme
VPAEFMKWTKAGGSEMKGLVRRRRAEAALWRGDLEDAETYLGMKFGPMPQEVDPPKPPKTMAESKIGNGTLVGGAAGTVAAGKEVADAVKEATETGADLWNVLADAGPWILLALVVVVAAGYVWWSRRQKLVEDMA